MKLHKLFYGQLLAVLFHKLIDIIVIQLYSHDLDQRHNLADFRLHRYVSENPQTHSTMLSGQSPYQAEVRVLLVSSSLYSSTNYRYQCYPAHFPMILTKATISLTSGSTDTCLKTLRHIRQRFTAKASTKQK
ncbi:hypothetical protein AVEN_77486-1 [Araneus ventricosus]|uniref:Uncharacterized protein n=1 Tax=Araneus ventricosus TaxID=182803 RepID=A0A4Y2NIZ0_ARAVE|nr:hypothetical protein AVEN_77486-1 [Araneus ventricosus]